LIAGLISGDWDPDKLDRGATEIFWSGTGIAFGAFLALGYALWPRVANEAGTRLATYYGNVRMHKDPADLKDALARSEQRAECLIVHLTFLSDLVWKKYRGIRWAMRLYGIAVVVCMAAVVVG